MYNFSMKIKFIAIAALGKDRQIGLNGALPWNYPDEFNHFKQTVKGQYVLTGRKNFEVSKGLEDSKVLVLTKNPEYTSEKAEVFTNINDLKEFAHSNDINTIYVIGGAQIYEFMLPYISEFLCSVVDYEGEADTYFPEYLFYEWDILDTQIHPNWSMYHMKKVPDHD